jgi:hypothetical protein
LAARRENSPRKAVLGDGERDRRERATRTRLRAAGDKRAVLGEHRSVGDVAAREDESVAVARSYPAVYGE